MIPPSDDLMIEWSRSRQDKLRRLARKRRPAPPVPPIPARPARVKTPDGEVVLSPDGVTVAPAPALREAYDAEGQLAAPGR